MLLIMIAALAASPQVTPEPQTTTNPLGRRTTPNSSTSSTSSTSNRVGEVVSRSLSNRQDKRVSSRLGGSTVQPRPTYRPLYGQRR